MKLHLIVAEGKHAGKVIPVPGPQFIIGRHRQCQLKAASAVIGKHHCALLIRGDKALVHDFDSVNGTFVNGERVKGEREVHNEDRLKVGPLVFLIWLEQTGDKPKAATPAGDSTIVRMLLGQDKSGAPAGVLDVSSDSEYGSTILHNPDQAKPSKKQARSAKPKPQEPAAAEMPAAARAILERYQQRSDS
jgi:pSer/pThr/pTyr-binding forkhead associated (FHA) protein